MKNTVKLNLMNLYRNIENYNINQNLNFNSANARVIAKSISGLYES